MATQPGKELLGLRPGRPTPAGAPASHRLPRWRETARRGLDWGLTQMPVLLPAARLSECSAPAQGERKAEGACPPAAPRIFLSQLRAPR